MKKTMLLSAFMLLFAAALQARPSGNFGLGMVIGAPTGLSLKYWTGANTAVEGALAVDTWHSHWNNGHYADYDNGTDLYLHVNYLWHKMNAIPVRDGQFPVYGGVGGRLIAGNSLALGVRGCGGLAYRPASIPFDFFFELGLVVDFIGDWAPGAGMDAGLGARFYF